MHPFENLKEFLFGSQRPWLPENSIETKYRSLLLDLKEYIPIQNLNFELKFLRHINDKTQFYVRLIQNQKLQVLDNLIPEIIGEHNPQVSKFLFNSLLTKQLQTFIKDIGKVVKEKNFDIGYLNPRKNTFDIDSHHKSNTFIIHYLKFTIIQIYLELQSLFQISPSEELIEEDFYTRLLFEKVPETLYFKTRQLPLEIEPVSSVSSAQNESHVETKTTYESFKYKQFSTNPDKIENLFDSLKKDGFIHQSSDLRTFKSLFSGGKIKSPTRWTGNKSEFYYFIKRIYNDLGLLEDLKQNQWIVASKCFTDTNNGTFDARSLRTQKKPATSTILDKSINNLI
jgi:hypothetical protein